MSIFRRNNPNNLPRTDLLNTILPSQHKLRTHPQPNPTSHTRPPTTPPPHGYLMTPSQLNKHSNPPHNQPNSRTHHHHLPLQLILNHNPINRSCNPTNRLLHPIHTHDNPTRTTTLPHHLHPELLHPRAPTHGPTHNPHNPPHPQTRTHLRHPHMQV